MITAVTGSEFYFKGPLRQLCSKQNVGGKSESRETSWQFLALSEVVRVYTYVEGKVMSSVLEKKNFRCLCDMQIEVSL